MTPLLERWPPQRKKKQTGTDLIGLTTNMRDPKKHKTAQMLVGTSENKKHIVQHAKEDFNVRKRDASTRA